MMTTPKIYFLVLPWVVRRASWSPWTRYACQFCIVLKNKMASSCRPSWKWQSKFVIAIQGNYCWYCDETGIIPLTYCCLCPIWRLIRKKKKWLPSSMDSWVEVSQKLLNGSWWNLNVWSLVVRTQFWFEADQKNKMCATANLGLRVKVLCRYFLETIEVTRTKLGINAWCPSPPVVRTPNFDVDWENKMASKWPSWIWECPSQKFVTAISQNLLNGLIMINLGMHGLAWPLVVRVQFWGRLENSHLGIRVN